MELDDVLVEDDLRLVPSRFCSKLIAVVAQSIFKSGGTGLCWHSELDEVGVDLNLFVLVVLLLVVAREGGFASDMENAEEKRLFAGNECGSLLSLPKAKSSKPLDGMVILWSPNTLEERGRGRSCCCCCCCCCPAEGARESSSSRCFRIRLAGL